ncbi:choice-of-anchor X domain-containing protein [Streptomyces sp. NPDC093109]|uniref:choice-of-anchor X domain-containing protein n=1 Tax=Streptomyces sp. NPDC093109 TaxID=3154977 RepID=UPI00344D20DC
MPRVLGVLGAAAVFLSPLVQDGGPRPVPAAASEPAFPSVNYVVAVDESASLAPEDMSAEKSAAARIALGDVSATSSVTVFGFAAAESDGQSAVDPVCPRTTLDAAGRESIGACVGKLRGRKKSEGTGTDFPAAIRQGVHELTNGTDASVPRVLFLLTDGVLDVTDSEKYGAESHRAEEGERQLEQALKDATDARVQIWPLGFGPAPDKAQLDRMAAGGYQKGCVELPSARPTSRKVSGAKDVGPMLEQTFAAAHCLRYQRGDSKLPPATLEVAISPLATVGSIVVDKGDPEVTITYTDPLGHRVPASGTYEKSRFELAGAGDNVEALKIVDPVPGIWKVKAEAPEGHRSLPVGVSVLWQGELRGAITMDPPSPEPGRTTTVTMRLQTREGYEIADPKDYAGLRVRGELTGEGFAAVPLRLADDGKDTDRAAGDGEFTGSVQIPKSATGTLKVSGTLTASGLRADTRSEGGRVAPAVPAVTAALSLPGTDVHPGGRITGSLAVHNTTGTPHTLRLSVTDLAPGLLSLTPAEIVVKPGESARPEVTVEVAGAGAFGGRLDGDGLRLGGIATVVDSTDGDRALVRSSLSVRVTPEPGLWDRYWGAFVAAAVAVALLGAAAVAWLRQRRTRRDPFGLVLQLVTAEGEILSPHPAGHGTKQWYEFAVVEAHRSPRIERRANGPYAVRRSPEGGAVLRTRGGGLTRLPARGQVPLADCPLSLSLGEDTRAGRPGRSGRGGRRGRNARSRAGTGTGAAPFPGREGATGSGAGAGSGTSAADDTTATTAGRGGDSAYDMYR